MRRAEPHAAAAGSTAAKQLRALIPPMTPGLILRVLFGVFLFFGGIVFGVWLIIRSRRLDRGNAVPDALRLRRPVGLTTVLGRAAAAGPGHLGPRVFGGAGLHCDRGSQRQGSVHLHQLCGLPRPPAPKPGRKCAHHLRRLVDNGYAGVAGRRGRARRRDAGCGGDRRGPERAGRGEYSRPWRLAGGVRGAG